MGMEVKGKNPTTKTGEYFRNNVWWWRPLAEYVCEVAPEIAVGCEYWQSNDGDGLDENGARELAGRLREEIASGRTATYAMDRQTKLDALPREKCEWCKGTGVRRDWLGTEMAMPEKVITVESHPRYGERGWCNGCDGVGSKESMECSYGFSVENVQKFAEFLEASGGFEIW